MQNASTKYRNLFRVFSTEPIFINILAFSFLILSLVEVFFSIQFTEGQEAFPRFIANIVFFNALHLGITFFLIFETEAFLNWKKHTLKSTFSFHQKLIFLFICFWLFQFFCKDMIYKIGTLLISFYGFYHVIKQQLGISLSFNHKSSHLNKTSNNLIRGFDHIFFNLLILISWVFISIEHFSFLRKSDYIIYVQCSFFSVVLIYIVINYIAFGRAFFNEKLYFFPRLLIYPLLPVSFLALIGWLSIHGMEYLFVTKNFISLKKKSFKKTLFSFGFLFFIIIALLSFVNQKAGFFALLDIESPEPLNKIFWVTLGACQLLHYWVDGKIFRMKDPLVRKYIAPVLNEQKYTGPV